LDTATISHFFKDGVDTGIFILEDKVREIVGQSVESWKVPGKTAIPCGVYDIEMRYSPHFKCELPHLLGVPGYTYVLMHWGNTSADTDGCLLTGQTWAGGDFIGHSKDLFFGTVLPMITKALAGGEKVQIKVGPLAA
jgi:hypothetical protein